MTPPSPSVDLDARRTGRRSRGKDHRPRPVAPPDSTLDVVVAGPAVEVVLPRPAVEGVVAVQGVDGQSVTARLGQGDVHLGGHSPRTKAPNASPATRMDSSPSVPSTRTASAWQSAPPVRNVAFLSPHHRLTCSVRDWELAAKVPPQSTAPRVHRPRAAKKPA